MALNTDWQRPPFAVLRAAHAELVVTDLERSRAFYVDLLGLAVSEETDDAIYLRGLEDRIHHSLVLRLGPEALVDHLAFRVAAPEDLKALEAHFQSLGCPTWWVDEEQERGQGPGPALRTQDPLGYPVEFFYDMRPVDSLLQRFELHGGAHVMRLDHFNLHVPDAAEAYEHYRGLGFRCSEYYESDDDGRLGAAWMYRKPTVHDVAFTSGDGPRLHHIGLTVEDRVSILRICDVTSSSGWDAALERGPGRHGTSNAFFLYLRDPDGHRIELYVGDYYTGDPDFQPIRWSLDDPRRRTFWGHAVPHSWYAEGSNVAGVDGAAVPLRPPLLSEIDQALVERSTAVE